MPVHSCFVCGKDLEPIDTHVPNAGKRFCYDAGQGDKLSSVVGPALQDRKFCKIDVITGEDHLLARRRFVVNDFRREFCHPKEGREHGDFFAQPLRRFNVDERLHIFCDLLQIVRTEGHRHS